MRLICEYPQHMFLLGNKNNNTLFKGNIKGADQTVWMRRGQYLKNHIFT